MKRRVVVTGFGGITALGHDWPEIRTRMVKGETAIRFMEDWQRFSGINTRLAAPIAPFSFDSRFPRKKTRTMGPVAKMAVLATERALEDAGLIGAPVLAEWLAANVPQGLAIFALPVGHRRRLWTSNMLELLDEEIRRRTRVAGLFPNEASALQLVVARSPASPRRAVERRLDSRS